MIEIPQIRYVVIKQLMPTVEVDIHIPQLHYTQIPVIGDIILDQSATIVDKIAIKQEWQ